jgi:hypothetical protein
LQAIAVAIDKEDNAADRPSPRSDHGREFCRGSLDNVLIVELAEKANSDLVAAMLERCLLDLGADTDYPYLPLYWEEAGRTPYLFRVGEEAVGFGLVRDMEDGIHEIAEFWIEPPFGFGGNGRNAAIALFQAHPGEWRATPEI